MPDFITCENIGSIPFDALIAALVVKLPDGTNALRTMAVAADCGTAVDGADCSNNGAMDAEQAFRSTIGIDVCGKPAIRLATSS